MTLRKEKLSISCKLKATFSKGPRTHKELIRRSSILINDYQSYVVNGPFIYTLYVISLLASKSRKENDKYVYETSYSGCYEFNIHPDELNLPIDFSYHGIDFPINPMMRIDFDLIVNRSLVVTDNFIADRKEDMISDLQCFRRWKKLLLKDFGVLITKSDGIIVIDTVRYPDMMTAPTAWSEKNEKSSVTKKVSLFRSPIKNNQPTTSKSGK